MVCVNVFLITKMPTMKMKGGNMDQLYQGDGRLRMARSLERVWPGVVSVNRRFKRPQHVIKDAWKKFDTELKLKPGLSLENIQPNEYGLQLRQVKEIKSQTIRNILAENKKESSGE